MFKAPFSFDGRIRRIEYFLSGIIGGIVSSIAWALGVGTFVLGAASGSAGGSVFGYHSIYGFNDIVVRHIDCLCTVELYAQPVFGS